MPVIETASLTKRFRRVNAVTNIDLQVHEGSIYALMGPNGAGKTTFIKLLMNLIAPSEGRAIVLGQDSEQLHGRSFEEIGYVSENQKLPDWMSVADFFSYWRAFYPRWDRAVEARLVKRFELPPKQKLKSLSRGVRMKASLTSALAFRPRLIVLDEPLSGLDPLVRDDLMETLRNLTAETTVLFSSHDLAEIESFATHVGYMDGGRLLLSEEMHRVRVRFRRMTALGESPLRQPAALPPEWTQFALDGSVAHWVESDYDADRSAVRATEVFGPVSIAAEPLTLREVFLAMARLTRPGQRDGDDQ